MARSVGRRHRERSFVDRLLRRPPRVLDIDPADLRDAGEDVWRGFRF